MTRSRATWAALATAGFAIVLSGAAEGQSFSIEGCKALFRDAARSGRTAARTGLADLAKKTAVESREAATVLDEKQRTPLGAGDVAPNLNSAASFSAGDENGRGFLRFSNELDHVGDLTWALKVSVPFDKKRSEGVFASRAGLSGDIAFTASMARYGWDLELVSFGEELCKICEMRGIGMADCYAENPDVFSPQQLADGESIDGLFGKVAARMWGLEGSIGRKDRSYFDAQAVEQDEDRLAMAVSLTGGLHLQYSSVFAKLTGKKDYEEGDTVQRCTSVDGALGLESCEQLPLGRAEETEKLVAAAEWVKQFPKRNFLPGFALAPGADYDLEESEWNASTPDLPGQERR